MSQSQKTCLIYCYLGICKPERANRFDLTSRLLSCVHTRENAKYIFIHIVHFSQQLPLAHVMSAPVVNSLWKMQTGDRLHRESAILPEGTLQLNQCHHYGETELGTNLHNDLAKVLPFPLVLIRFL